MTRPTSRPKSRSTLDRGSFAQLTSIVTVVTGVVNGWTMCDTDALVCTIFFVFTPCKKLTTGRLLRWRLEITLFMVEIVERQPFCVRVRSVSFALLGDARPSWSPL